ncbi:hypothetical protein, partial [Mesorhizobium sp. M1A.F.Ca.IN.020.06.1.1]|uniref:hypothetical protein n=1 Tax=Mesorhizobium sp. M1A.F.Ca.IN.020.06.1.1 TaxID=2496765 RepID=UPI0019D44CA9
AAIGACMSRQASWRSAISLRVRRFPSVVLHDEPAIPGPPAVVGESEEGEGLGPPLAAPLMREGREPAKLDQPRLVLMSIRPKLASRTLRARSISSASAFFSKPMTKSSA